ARNASLEPSAIASPIAIARSTIATISARRIEPGLARVVTIASTSFAHQPNRQLEPGQLSTLGTSVGCGSRTCAPEASFRPAPVTDGPEPGPGQQAPFRSPGPVDEDREPAVPDPARRGAVRARDNTREEMPIMERSDELAALTLRLY